MNITVDLKEGMQISPKEDNEKVYTLVISNTDNEMYGFFGSDIIKISDLEDLDTSFVCINVSHFEEEVKVIETENNNMYLVENEFDIYSFIQNELDEYETDFQDVSMKISKMKRKQYMIKTGLDYSLRVKDIIAEKYQELKIKDKNV